MRRVVVTGLGMISAVGNDVESGWQRIINGDCGVDKISAFDASSLTVQIAAQVSDLDREVIGIIDAKEARRASRYIKLAAVASQQAITMSGAGLLSNPKRCGCAIGVGLGALEDIEKNTVNLVNSGQKKVSPFFIPYTIPNMATGLVSKYHNLQGVNLAPTAACASGNQGIGEGFRAIKYNYSDVMVCGGAEAAISPLGIAAFANMKALSVRNDHPQTASRPFDAQRDGFVTGEGAGMLVLEELNHATARGARIYAEVLGYGNSGDAYHITAPRPQGEGMKEAMNQALQEARVAPAKIDYINAHGTSTQLNDRYESEAIGSLFADHANNLAISSTKGATGHCLGGAGGIEAVVTVLAIRDRLVPPTINYQYPDQHCPWNYVPNRAQQLKVTYALSNSFGFGGVNATLVFAIYR